MKRLPDEGIFRTPQSFTLLTAEHLLEKLRWDLKQLESLRWDEDATNWRQVVSYKATECATSIWHLIEWFAADIQAEEPRERTRQFLGLEVADPWKPIHRAALRRKALELCPDLDLCRVIAVATKHYKVDDLPRTDVRTEAYLAIAHRGNEPYPRPVMWLAVYDRDSKRDMREVFHNCLRFWEKLNYVSGPGSPWKAGDPIPEGIHSPLEPLTSANGPEQSPLLRQFRRKLANILNP